MLSSAEQTRITALLKGRPDFVLDRTLMHDGAHWHLLHLPSGEERPVASYAEACAFMERFTVATPT